MKKEPDDGPALPSNTIDPATGEPWDAKLFFPWGEVRNKPKPITFPNPVKCSNFQESVACYAELERRRLWAFASDVHGAGQDIWWLEKDVKLI